MNNEYGIERYADLLSKYFKDNPGYPGPDGGPNMLVAKSTGGFSVLELTTISLEIQTFAAGELTPDDTISINWWVSIFNLMSFTIDFKWQTASGDQIQIFQFNLPSPSQDHYLLTLSQATGIDTAVCDDSYLVATTQQSIANGTKSTNIVQILNADMTPKHNWITESSAIVAVVTTGAGIGFMHGAHGQFYISCMKHTA